MTLTLNTLARSVALASIYASAMAAPAFAQDAAGSCATADLVIGYVNPSVTNQGWIVIGQGAQDAADERGVELRVFGPPREGDAFGQATVIQDLIAAGANALVVAPVDSTAITPAVIEANEAGIPVINLDSLIEGTELASFVATDNYAAAAEQAQVVADKVGESGEVVLINGSQAYSTGRDRRNGFVEKMAEIAPNIEVIEVQTEWDAQAAQRGLEDALAAHPDVRAVANAWDGATVAAVPVLNESGSDDGIFLVGFDGAADAIALMLQGKVDAIVAQRLYNMGHTAVDTAVDAACGEVVEERIDTGFVVLTPDNVEAFIADNPPVMREFIDQASSN